MDMHPWDFYEYTWEELLLKLRGYFDKEKEEWTRSKFIAYCAFHSARDVKQPFDKWLNETVRETRLSRLKGLEKSERMKRALEIKQKYIDAGYITNN